MHGERFNLSTILDGWVSSGHAEAVAVACGKQRVTYGELLELTCRIGAGLSELGVKREDRVLLALFDTPWYVATFLGCIRAGFVPVPVNPLLPASDLREVLEDSGASAAVADGAALPALSAATKPGTGILAVSAGAEVEGATSLATLVAMGHPDLPPAGTRGDDIAFLLYSSGSTGRPKGVVHRQQDLPFVCRTYGKQVLAVNEKDVAFSTSKMYHAYGLCNSLAFPLWFGGKSVLLPDRPDLLRVFDTIEQHRPTLFFSTPGLFDALLRAPGAAERELSSVRMCLSAAEALPTQVWRRWEQTYGLPIIDGIGSTEMLGIFCTNRPDDIRPGTTGLPVPGYEMRLIGNDGNVVEGAGSGALQVSGDSAFAAYWRQHERTKQAISGCWVSTGDRYRRDPDGYYTYLGRNDDMVKVSGLWVSPIDVESVLVSHPAVREAAVVGVADGGFTRLKAFVVAGGCHDSDALRDELRQWCMGELQRHQIPRFIELVEELPKTATGKIQRYRLRGS